MLFARDLRRRVLRRGLPCQISVRVVSHLIGCMKNFEVLDDPTNIVRLLCDVRDAYAQQLIRHGFGVASRAGPKAGLKKKIKGKIVSNTWSKWQIPWQYGPCGYPCASFRFFASVFREIKISTFGLRMTGKTLRCAKISCASATCYFWCALVQRRFSVWIRFDTFFRPQKSRSSISVTHEHLTLAIDARAKLALRSIYIKRIFEKGLKKKKTKSNFKNVRNILPPSPSWDQDQKANVSDLRVHNSETFWARKMIPGA